MIIGICGFINAGKTTVANMLVSNFEFEKYSFASTLKDAVAPIFNWDREKLEGETEETRLWREQPDPFWSEAFGKPFTPRMALQLMGTEAGRNVFHQNIWIKSLENRIRDKKAVVIHDCRFPNEIQFLKRMNGFLVRVKRDPDPEWYSTAENQNRKIYFNDENVDIDQMQRLYPNIHSSEWSWVGAQYDYILYNVGSLEGLKQDVAHMMKVFKGPQTQN